ncbi:hypothetical protein D3C76_704870 [compost metagenome]
MADRPRLCNQRQRIEHAEYRAGDTLRTLVGCISVDGLIQAITGVDESCKGQHPLAAGYKYRQRTKLVDPLDNRFDHGTQIVAIDLCVVTNGGGTVPRSLLHPQHKLCERIGGWRLIVKADVVGRIPITIVVEETGIVGQPMRFRVHRHAVHRGQHARMESAILAINLTEVRRQGLFRVVGAALSHHPLVQLRNVGELMQRRGITREVHQQPITGCLAKHPNIGRGIAIKLQAARRDFQRHPGGCLQLFDHQGFPGLIRWQTGCLHRQGKALFAQALFLTLQPRRHDECRFGRRSQGVRTGSREHLVRRPGVIKIGFIAFPQVQFPYPSLEIRRPQVDLGQRAIGLWNRWAINAFVRLMIAAAMIGEFIDVLDNPHARPDVRWCVQTEGRFSKTSITNDLVIGQKRLQQ